MPIIAALPYLGTAGLAALRLAPSLVRAGSKIIPQGIKRNFPIVPYRGPGLPAVTGGGARVGSGSVPSAGGGATTAGGSSIFRSPSMFTAGAAVTSLPFMLTEPTPLVSSAEESASGGGITEEQKKRDAEDEQTGVGKKRDDGTKPTIDDINKGDLDDYISKNIGLFEKYLGDGKEKTKAAGFQALTEFGLNLAMARGGNLIDKIARAAKDPLKTFAEIGKAAANRADKIKMAAIETGIQQSEAAKDRAESDKPDDVKTLEYFLSIPALKNKPIEELIRLSKAKATMSDEDFRKEVIISLTPQVGTTIQPNALPGIVESVVSLGTGTGGGTGGGLSVQEQVDLAKEQGASNDEIRESLRKNGYDPKDYGF